MVVCGSRAPLFWRKCEKMEALLLLLCASGRRLTNLRVRKTSTFPYLPPTYTFSSLSSADDLLCKWFLPNGLDAIQQMNRQPSLNGPRRISTTNTLAILKQIHNPQAHLSLTHSWMSPHLCPMSDRPHFPLTLS